MIDIMKQGLGLRTPNKSTSETRKSLRVNAPLPSLGKGVFMDIEVNRMFPAAISRFKTLRPQQRYARLRVRVFFCTIGAQLF